VWEAQLGEAQKFLSSGCTITITWSGEIFMSTSIPDKEIIPHVDALIENYRGNANELEQAIGVWIVGRKFGWKVMLLVHDRKTLAKYETILGIDFRNELEEVGPLAKKSMAWKAFQGVTNFWKAVRGEIPGIKSPDLR
jgi:hypothetical protein